MLLSAHAAVLAMLESQISEMCGIQGLRMRSGVQAKSQGLCLRGIVSSRTCLPLPFLALCSWSVILKDCKCMYCW